MLDHNLNNIEVNTKNDEQHGDVVGQQVEDKEIIQFDDSQEEHVMLHDDDLGETPKLPQVSTKRFNRLIKPFLGILLMS